MKDLRYDEKMCREEMLNGVIFKEVFIWMGQKIILEDKVIYRWEFKKDVVDEMYELIFLTHQIRKKDNFSGHQVIYEVQSNAKGKPILVRVSNV